MKVALFVHCFFPEHFYGTETYTLHLARHLRDLGHQPTVVSAVFQGEPRRAERVNRYQYEGISVVCIDKNYIPHSRVKETYYQESMRDVLHSILRELAPDIVHVTHLINHTAVLLEVAHELRIPSVATMTDFFGFCLNNKLETAEGKLCEGPNKTRSNCISCHLRAAGEAGNQQVPGWLAHSSMVSLAGPILVGITSLPGLRTGPLAGLVQDIRWRPDILKTCYAYYRAVIAPTRFLRDAYVANGITNRCFNIHFGVDLPRTPKPVRPTNTPLRFGFIGQIARHKGVDLLIDAFRALPVNLAELFIYGPEHQSPQYMESLRKAAQGFPIYFKDTFPSAQIVSILAELDVLVIPSRWYENSPLVLLDALASHTPVVVADVAGLTEFIESGRDGFSFERGSVRSLKNVLGQFIIDPGLARRMSVATVYERTTKSMVEDVLSVYHYALEGL